MYVERNKEGFEPVTVTCSECVFVALVNQHAVRMVANWIYSTHNIFPAC